MQNILKPGLHLLTRTLICSHSSLFCLLRPCSQCSARSPALIFSLTRLLRHSLLSSYDIGIFLSNFQSVLSHCAQFEHVLNHLARGWRSPSTSGKWLTDWLIGRDANPFEHCQCRSITQISSEPEKHPFSHLGAPNPFRVFLFKTIIFLNLIALIVLPLENQISFRPAARSRATTSWYSK